MKTLKQSLAVLFIMVSLQACLHAQVPHASSAPTNGTAQQAQLEKQLADAKSAFEKSSSENKGIHLATARQLVDAYMANGMKAEALAVVENQKELVDAALGLASQDALNVRFLLARTTAQTQGLEAGISVLQSFVDLRSKNLGEAHVATLNARQGMAGFLWGARRQRDAVELQQKTVAIINAKLGADSKESVLATRELADYFYEGKVYDQALPLYELIFPKMLTADGPESRQVEDCALKMGIMYLQTNPVKAVEKLEFYRARYL